MSDQGKFTLEFKIEAATGWITDSRSDVVALCGQHDIKSSMGATRPSQRQRRPLGRLLWGWLAFGRDALETAPC